MELRRSYITPSCSARVQTLGVGRSETARVLAPVPVPGRAHGPQGLHTSEVHQESQPHRFTAKPRNRESSCARAYHSLRISDLLLSDLFRPESTTSTSELPGTDCESEVSSGIECAGVSLF